MKDGKYMSVRKVDGEDNGVIEVKGDKFFFLGYCNDNGHFVQNQERARELNVSQLSKDLNYIEIKA